MDTDCVNPSFASLSIQTYYSIIFIEQPLNLTHADTNSGRHEFLHLLLSRCMGDRYLFA
jgi:hypothetical protein